MSNRPRFCVHLADLGAGASLDRVLAAHKRRFGRDTALVVVNPTYLDLARSQLAALGRQVELEACAGVLTWEVWTLIEDGQRPATLREIEAARRELSPEEARQLALDLEVRDAGSNA